MSDDRQVILPRGGDKMGHMKRYLMPKYWPIPRKGEVFVTRPRPGPHSILSSMPLQVIVRDLLGYAEGAGEARRILRAGKLMVDGKVRKDPNFPVGLMDVVGIADTKEHFRVSVNRNGLFLEKIAKAHAGSKLCRIEGKNTLKGGKVQLNLHDGRNLLLKKDAYKVGDSLLISVPEQRIIRHFSLAKGAHGLIIAGRNMGVDGKVAGVKHRKGMMEKATITLTSGKKEIQTLKKYVMVGEFALPQKRIDLGV
jgi:small subunit ribosomal protein S4e